MIAFNQALIVLARDKEITIANTRLKDTVGDFKTREILHQLLSHTQETASYINIDKYVVLEDMTDHGLWEEYIIFPRLGHDAGESMSLAFNLVFATGYQEVVMIGMDCPYLSPELLEEAFAALKHNQVVIGPAQHGGFYLLGMQCFYPELFDFVDAASSDWLRRLLTAIHQMQLRFAFLPTLNVVQELADVPEDWL
ncbi:TIGR04282 family arsenosugar biosynthesis glycosyltransferase [Chitinophaga qingshengii]|uniref:DUF2064 domain-containing protein n=1 Tax=Chitinophaga qingshengii TaxID=1569794 RepID=A0ABR7TRH8_9BACT|nr:DUF2064 domain-containing protein [Chitinophaga qingshengii]MBC9932230.1 DUF2064 domain-containing protein [Chitinophaga qingshengii]